MSDNESETKSCDEECSCKGCIAHRMRVAHILKEFALIDDKWEKLANAHRANEKHVEFQNEKIRTAQRIKEKYEKHMKDNEEDAKELGRKLLRIYNDMDRWELEYEPERKAERLRAINLPPLPPLPPPQQVQQFPEEPSSNSLD